MSTNSAIAVMTSLRRGPATGLNPARGGCLNSMSDNRRRVAHIGAVVFCLVGLVLRPPSVSAQTVSSTSLSFGNVAINQTSFYQTVKLTNNGTTALKVGTPSITANFGIAPGGTCAPSLSLSASKSCTYFVTFTPIALSAYTGTLTINVSGGTTSSFSIALSGTGSVPAEIAFFPTGTLSFGNVALGTTSASTQIVVKNFQSTELLMTPPVLSGEFTILQGTCTQSLPPETSCTYYATFTPAALGTRNSVLNIVTNTSNSPLTLNLTGVGVAPAVTSPTSETFGSEAVGSQTGTRSVKLISYETIGINLSSPTTTGDFVVAPGGTCGSYLPAKGSCTYNVAFAPQATGVRSGSLVTSDSALNSPQTVTLSGTGANPTASIINVTPGVGQTGATLKGVQVTGRYTHFTQATPAVSFGSGITVSTPVTVTSDTLLSVNLTINSKATPGSRTVTVATGTEKAQLTAGFVVSASAGLSFSSVSPNAAAQGQTLNVTITGNNTHFAQGTTVANFGGGITVNSLTVASTTSATASITVSGTTFLPKLCTD